MELKRGNLLLEREKLGLEIQILRAKMAKLNQVDVVWNLELYTAAVYWLSAGPRRRPVWHPLYLKCCSTTRCMRSSEWLLNVLIQDFRLFVLCPWRRRTYVISYRRLFISWPQSANLYISVDLQTKLNLLWLWDCVGLNVCSIKCVVKLSWSNKPSKAACLPNFFMTALRDYNHWNYLSNTNSKWNVLPVCQSDIAKQGKRRDK